MSEVDLFQVSNRTRQPASFDFLRSFRDFVRINKAPITLSALSREDAHHAAERPLPGTRPLLVLDPKGKVQFPTLGHNGTTSHHYESSKKERSCEMFLDQ